MAIYYIDPHTTTNGTGTWASPWSVNTAHTGLVAGDEIRIKGIALTSLLTATSYTATVTNNYQLTITAGGGLGADWAAGNIAYLPAFDTFFRVYSVTGNVIQAYTSSSMLPINNTSTTTVTVRRVDTTTYPPGTASSAYYLAGSYATTNNITISDCWTDAVTRVTDGTVKTLLNSSYTSSMTLYLDTSTAGNPTGWTVNLQNTHVMCAQGTSNGTVVANIYASNSTYNIGQIYAHYSQSTGLLTFGNGTTSTPDSNTINVTHLACAPVINNGYATNITLNITNYVCYYIDYAYNTGLTGLSNMINYSITYDTIVAGAINYSAMLVFNNAHKGTITYTSIFDMYANSSVAYVYYGTGGNVTINFGAGFVSKYNKRVSNKTSYSTLQQISSLPAGRTILPTVSIPTGATVTTTYGFSTLGTPTASKTGLVPNVCNIECPTMPATAQLPYGNTNNVNILVTTRTGAAPIEILAISNTPYNSTGTQANFPNVSTDATVYRTTGPSLKSYLQTRSSAAWRAPAESIKTIKIPVTSGVTYSITGYVRTDDTAYTNGDCRMAIIFNNAELVYQDMTTSCINAWEKFTLSFTATQTCEVNLSWQMYYRTSAKSFWLDDVAVA